MKLRMYSNIDIDFNIYRLICIVIYKCLYVSRYIHV